MKSGDILSESIIVGIDSELIINDYFEGINISGGKVTLNERPGNMIVEKMKIFKEV